MGAKLKDFLVDPGVKKLACEDGLLRSNDLIRVVNDDRAYYEKVENAPDFLFGITYRQPEVSLRAVTSILSELDLNGTDAELAEAFRVAITSDDERKLLEHFRVVCRIGRKSLQYQYLDQVAEMLFKWKLGIKNPVKIAWKLFGRLEVYTRLRGIDVDLMAGLRREVPFDVWKQGLSYQ